MHIMILNGPNLNLLGTRNKAVYGQQTYADLVAYLNALASAKGHRITIRQSNHEGVLIDWLHEAHEQRYDAVILNAGAYTHTSYALHDAIEAITPPVVEVHLSDIATRAEVWRHISVIEPVCVTQFKGLGFQSYEAALNYCERHLDAQNQ